MSVAELVEQVLGTNLPVAFEAYDGSRCGPVDAPATIVLRSPTALQRIITAPGELGFGRAYVAGDLDVEGSIWAALALRDRLPSVKLEPKQLLAAVKLLGAAGLRRPTPPPEEARLHGRRHSKSRDAAAIAHHYDVSNEFYALFLGSTMTYSCAVWADPSVGLDAAQDAKYELICRKLDLRPGTRLLDIGCGWGGMVMHAARHHGVTAVGVTLSRRQAELAEKRVAEAGLGNVVEIRMQDYRDVHDGPYDAISSIGMFEHVGLSQVREYFESVYSVLRPHGRFLNHAIGRPPGFKRTRMSRRGFIDRYVFPDGELHEVGTIVSAIQDAGFEVRHLENLREHYALTLRAWVANLEANWDEAVAQAGLARARIWRLYMAGSALNFEAGHTQIHQVLATRSDDGISNMPLRPVFEQVAAPV
ncbi:MAG: class I SAM-dependent methyltransferase [Acidimicrobiia bacterium]|nr:class I SAM-dependent methyltransferase [Acidimicrobiia bacterium]